MTDYEEIYNYYIEKGFTFSVNNRGTLKISRNGEAKKADALAGLFEGKDFEYDGGIEGFLSDVKKKLQEPDEDKDVCCGLEYGTGSIKLICERFKHLRTLNDIDRRIYSRFKFVHTGVKEISLLVQVKNREWTAIPLSLGPHNTNRETIAPICAKIVMESGHTLTEYMTRELELCQKEASKVLLARDDRGNVDTTAVVAMTYFPRCLCANKLVHILSHNYVTQDGKERKVVDGFTLESFDPIYDFNVCLPWLLNIPEMFMNIPRNVSNSPDEDCLHYIDLDEIRSHFDEPCPAWDKYLTRYTEDEAAVFKAWIWGIFDASNHGRQMLYLHDTGQSGKSAVIKAITSVLGERLVAAAQKNTFTNQFGVAKIWDKRLITIGDNKNLKIIMSQFIHSVLGGDTMEVEFKGKNSFSARICCKVLVASNELPEIDLMADNETSRIIILQPKLSEERMEAEGLLKKKANGDIVRLPSGRPQNLGDGRFEKALCDEFKAFLAHCEADYNALCPTGENIALPDSLWDIIRTAQSTPEQAFEDIFSSLFEETGDTKDFLKRLSMQQAFDVYCNEHTCYKSLQYSDFKTWMLKKTQIRQGSNTDGLRGFRGIILKDKMSTTPTFSDIQELDTDEDV